MHRNPIDNNRNKKNNAPDFFHMKWASAWIDEAHEFRGPHRGFVGGVQLRKQSEMMSCCTATPLYTKPSVRALSGSAGRYD